MWRIEHRRLDDMEVDADIMIVRKLGKLTHIIHVRPGDAHVEETPSSCTTHVLDQVFEIRPDWSQRFCQSRLFVDAVDREIDRSETGIAEAVDHVGFHQSPVGRQVDDRSPSSRRNTTILWMN